MSAEVVPSRVGCGDLHNRRVIDEKSWILVRIQVEVGRLRRRKPESEERKQLTGCPMPNIPATL